MACASRGSQNVIISYVCTLRPQLPSGNLRPLVKRAAETQLLQGRWSSKHWGNTTHTHTEQCPCTISLGEWQHQFQHTILGLQLPFKQRHSNFEMFKQFLQESLLTVNKVDLGSRWLACARWCIQTKNSNTLIYLYIHIVWQCCDHFHTCGENCLEWELSHHGFLPQGLCLHAKDPQSSKDKQQTCDH